MRIFKIILTILFVGFLGGIPASADVVVLKNGRSFEGTIANQNEKSLKLDSGVGVNITIFKDEIERIDPKPFVSSRMTKRPKLVITDDDARKIVKSLQSALDSSDAKRLSQMVLPEAVILVKTANVTYDIGLDELTKFFNRKGDKTFVSRDSEIQKIILQEGQVQINQFFSEINWVGNQKVETNYYRVNVLVKDAAGKLKLAYCLLDLI